MNYFSLARPRLDENRYAIARLLQAVTILCVFGTILACSKGTKPSEPAPTPVAGMSWRIVRQSWDYTGYFSLRSVLWDGSKFVAVGGDTLTYTSTDGITWQGHIRPESTFSQWTLLHDVTFGSGMYVAVGERNRVLTSVDATTWTIQRGEVTADTRDQFRFIHWNGQQFLAGGWYQYVGGDPFVSVSKLNYSTDGVSWPHGSVPFPQYVESMNGAGWNGSTWVVTSNSGTVMTSPDAQFWTVQVTNTPADMGQVLWVDSVFHVYPLDYSKIGSEIGVVLRSSDGITWTKRTMNTYLVHNICYTGTMFVGAHVDSIFTSTDGLAWTFRQKLALSRPNYTIYGFAWSGEKFVAVGEGGFIAVSP